MFSKTFFAYLYLHILKYKLVDICFNGTAKQLNNYLKVYKIKLPIKIS